MSAIEPAPREALAGKYSGEPRSETRQASEPKTGFAAWRETLLARVGYASIAVFIGAVAFSLILRRPTGMLLFGVILGIGYLVQQLLSRSNYSYRLRAWVFVATTVIASGYFYWFAGMQAGPIMAAAFTIVLASMLLGQRAFLGVVAFMVAGLLVMWATISSGLWEGPTPQIAELSLADRWFRSSIVTGVFWLGMASSCNRATFDSTAATTNSTA